MKIWIDRLLILAVLVLVLVLLGSTVPWMISGHLQGSTLLLHMFASGALVIVLPLLTISYMWQNISRFKSGGLQRLGFWLLVMTGLTTIATVFICMFPIASTPQMHQLMRIHGYAGFAMVPALALLVVGALRWRRIEATRSATPG